MISTTPDENPYLALMYSMAKRAGELAAMKMDTLRSVAGYDCSTLAEALEMNRYETKQSLVEKILTEEFDLECESLFTKGN